MKAVRVCLVCGRDGAREQALPSGRKAQLCEGCGKDDFRIAEAERRVELTLQAIP